MTVTFLIDKHWVTLSLDKGLITVVIDGKDTIHPNIDVDISHITLTELTLTREQIVLIHKENKEYYETIKPHNNIIFNDIPSNKHRQRPG